jgi:hypothetical protein
MKLTAFDQLNLKEKELILAEYGMFLLAVTIDQFRVNLFSLGTDCIELYYNMYLGKVEAICPITEYKEYDKFIEQIQIKL